MQPQSLPTGTAVPPSTPTPSPDVVETPGERLGISEADLRHHIEKMRSVARRLGADREHVADLVNDASVVACSKPKKRRPDPADRNGMRLWLCSIVTNITLAHARKRESAPDMIVEQDVLERHPDESNAALHVEDYSRLAMVFRSLDDAQRYLIVEHAAPRIEEVTPSSPSAAGPRDQAAPAPRGCL